MTALLDTNILVYVFDAAEQRKQRIALELLRSGAADRTIGIAHQALVEFYSAVTKRRNGRTPLLSPADAARETVNLLESSNIVYPRDIVVRKAIEAVSEFQIAWYDAHMWAYAEVFGMDTFFTEDLQHGRTYGGVRVINPFR